MTTQKGKTLLTIATALMLSLAAGTGLAEERLPAVSALNGKIAIAGGVVGEDGAYLIDGSVSIPVTTELGVQLDALIGTVDGDGVGGGAAHFFWRDPEVALAGIYVSGLASTAGGNYQLGNVGAEGALYLGQFAVEGLVGVQFSDVRSTEVAGSAVLAFYPVDDLRLYAGYRHWFGRNEGAFGAEWQLPGQSDGSMAFALYVDGRVREDDSAVLVGVRVYLGEDKSLIRRHREDDPLSPLSNDLFTASTVPDPGDAPAAQQPACDVATGTPNAAFIAQQQAQVQQAAARSQASTNSNCPRCNRPVIIFGC